MCGIAAIISQSPVSSKMLNCLLNLEYRGYDSCGMGIYHDGKIEVRKNVGGVNQVNQKECFSQMQGKIGIAHTRWATHGGVTKENAHPHISENGEFVIVHNGIISNYIDLRKNLEKNNFHFASDTDTEVFVNLVQYYFEKIKNVEQAFLNAIQDIKGSYSVVLLSTHEPDRLYAVKNESPLILGISKSSCFITSDINAFIAETRNAVILDDMEYVVLTLNGYQIKKVIDRSPIKKDITKIEWDYETAQKGGFSHYMLKEIFDQPQTIKNVLNIQENSLEEVANYFLQKEQSFFVGVGTTFFVAMIGSYLFSKFAGLYIPAISSDEFVMLIHPQPNHHILSLSQSGETYDTRMAIKHAKKAEATTSAIVNVVGSSISQMVDSCIFQASGPEICVVSTKAAMAQMIILYRLALIVGKKNHTISSEEAQNYYYDLNEFPKIIEQILNEESGLIRRLASTTKHIHNWLFMGKGIYYPIAMEAALKMKEVTYLHAEGLPAGFLKHGTLAMVDEDLYSLFFIPGKEDLELYKSTVVAIEEVKARGGKIIGFATRDDHDLLDLLDFSFNFPDLSINLIPFLQLIMVQLFSYYSALYLDRSIDKPRNLAKSVTVG